MAAKLSLVLSESSVNVANNTSVVTAKLYYYGNGVSHNYNNPSGTIKIDGTSYSFNHDFTTSSSAQLLATKSKTVTHNADGSKTVSVSATFKTGVSLGTMSTSATKTLTKIARASTLSLNQTSVPADGNTTVVVTATKQLSSFTDTITVTLGNYSQTVISGEEFVIPTEWVNAISGTSATATVKVTTMSGSTTIGSTTKSLTITVPDTAEFYPTINDVSITEAVSKVTDLFGNLYVQNLSQLNVSIDATGAYGSTISGYSTVLAGGIPYTQQAFTTNVINTSGMLEMSVVVTDSRGRTATKSVEIPVLEYVPPTITSMTYKNSETSTIVSIAGNVSSVGGQNAKVLKLKYKTTADEAYTERIVTVSDWDFNIDVTIKGTDPSVTYEYIAELTDKINVDNPATYKVTTGIVLLSRLAGGKGVTLFEEATEEGFVVGGGMPVKLTNPLAISSGGTGAITAENALSNLGVGDYIVSEEIIDSWLVTKYKSGRCRALFVYAPTMGAISTASGNMYRTASAVTRAMPTDVFTYVYGVKGFAAHNGTSWCDVKVSTYSTTQILWYLFTSASWSSGVSVNIGFEVEGKWN